MSILRTMRRFSLSSRSGDPEDGPEVSFVLVARHLRHRDLDLYRNDAYYR